MSDRPISRRTFVHAGAALPLALGIRSEDLAQRAFATPVDDAGSPVKLMGDGPSHTPAEYAQLLSSILAEGEIEPDYDSGDSRDRRGATSARSAAGRPLPSPSPMASVP